MYGEAKGFVETGKDIDAAVIFVCPTCGYTVIGDPPDKCPVCGVKKEKFSQF